MTSTPSAALAPCAFLPLDDPLRTVLHNEVHARPPAKVRLPALIVQVAVLNAGVNREQECGHLRLLPGYADLPLERLHGNFARLSCGDFTVKWERHTEFTRYSIVQPLPDSALLGAQDPELLPALAVTPEWLRSIPGRTVSAIQLVMVEADLSDEPALMAQAQTWFGGRSVVASQLGHGHSWGVTEFRIGADGFERMLVITTPGTSQTRAGRISQRLLELEIYRLMALRGLPVAKQLAPT
ncbi:MAG: DUF3422 family protein, partial [Polaromonas sp.]|nr:DUF3422 family protein [Polaromonas sp.]